MTVYELYKEVLGNLFNKELHPLHKAVLEECCENVLKNTQNLKEKETLVYAVQVAFLTCNSILKGTLTSSLEAANAEQVSLNYRNQTFIIPKNSPLLK